jgi:hypothetical protein
MRIINVFISCLIAVSVYSVACDARAEDSKPIPLDSLVGKYEGILTYIRTQTHDLDFQIEIVSVNTADKTVSLVNYCRECDVKEWKRNNCRITDVKESIKFTCKGSTSDEEYTYNEGKLRASGSGKKYPYSISVTKVVK